MDSPSTSTRSPKDLQKIKKQQNDKENIKSCFSDDEVKMGEESRDDVTYLAEKEDVLKGSRADLFATMSARLKSMSPKKLKNNKDDAQGAASPTYNSWNIPQQKERAITLYKAANEDESPQKRTEKPFIYELDEQIPNQADVQESVPSLNDIKIKVEDKVSLPTIPEIAFNQDLSSRNDIKELPVLEGFLQKKTTNMFKPWQRRYFVLKNHKLYYYLDQNQEIKYGVFDFDLITVKLQKGQNEPTIMISIVGNSRVFVLKAANEQEREKWFEALRVHSLYSKGGYVDLSTVAKISKFWKNDRISPETFLQHAETGDILLFKSETIVSKIQRSVTLSEYDHIALLYRHRNNRLFLFEAMREGVGLCGWDVFTEKNWHKLYSKIVYRKLMVPRTPEITKELELFIKSNVGKKYKITPQKLLQKKAKAGKEENTFFCSELVAACYKKLKFLPGDISSAYYFPSNTNKLTNLLIS